MTRKDYELIAQAIANVWCDSEAQMAIAESLASELEQENPRFDRSRFLSACGVN